MLARTQGSFTSQLKFVTFEEMVELLGTLRKLFLGIARKHLAALRAPSVTIQALHAIGYCRANSRPEACITVANISTTGVGLFRSASPEWPRVGAEIHGDLIVVNRSFSQPLRVIHMTGEILGCEFINPTHALTETIENHFHADRTAVTMKRRLAPGIDASDTKTPYWFHGTNNCELFFIETDDGIVDFRLTFFANYLEGGLDSPIRFGIVTNDHDLGDEASGVRWLNKIDAEQLTATLSFLTHIPDLDAKHRDAILKLIC